MKKFLRVSLMCALLTGCAGIDWTAVGGDIIKDVQDGTVAANDAYTAYQALNQSLTTDNVTTGKLTVAKVFAAANAGATALNTPGLGQAVEDLVTDAKTTIANLQSVGASPKLIIAAVSQQGAGTISTIAALPQAASTTANVYKRMDSVAIFVIPGESRLRLVLCAYVTKTTPRGLRAPLGESDPLHVLMAKD